MSDEGPENPFRTPQSVPEPRSMPAGGARRIAGVGAYLFAGYFGFLGGNMILMSITRALFPDIDGIPASKPGRTVVFTLLAAWFGWSGYRLRSRGQGIWEWIPFAGLSIVIFYAIADYALFSMTWR